MAASAATPGDAGAPATTSIVILHHGLRERVVVDPARPLLLALEGYARKYGLNPLAYELRASAGGRDVAVNLHTAMQFSGIMSNQLLELVPRPGAPLDPSAVEARVALLMPSGERLEGVFWATATVADVLLSFIRAGSIAGYDEAALVASEWAGANVVNVRSTIRDRALTTTTLAALGFLKGTGTLRVNLPPPAASAAAAVASSAAAAAATAASPATAASTGVPTSGDAAAEPASAAAAAGPSTAASTAGDANDGITAPTAAKRARHADVAGDGGGGGSDGATPAPAPAPPAAAEAAAAPASRSAVSPLKAAVARASKGIERLGLVNESPVVAAVLSSLLTIVDNLLKFPGDTAKRALRLGNPKFHEAIGQHGGALEVLKSLGFVEGPHPTTREPALVLPLESESDDVTSVVRDVLAKAQRTSGGAVAAVPAPAPAPVASAPIDIDFDPYRASLTRISAVGGSMPSAASAAGAGAGAGRAGEATPLPPVPVTVDYKVLGARTDGAGAGSAASAAPSSVVVDGEAVDTRYMTGVELQVLTLKQKALEQQAANRPKSRATQVLLYRQPPSPSAASGGGGIVGAIHSALTGGSGAADGEIDERDPEVRAMRMEYARKKMAEVSTERPMTTKALRELEALRSVQVHTTTFLRVELPDRTALVGAFSPLDTLADVYAWLRSLFQADAPAFQLATTPPMTVHREAADVTLNAARWVPSRIVRLQWLEPTSATSTTSPSASAAAPVGGGAGAGTSMMARLGWGRGASAGGSGVVGGASSFSPGPPDSYLTPAAFAAGTATLAGEPLPVGFASPDTAVVIAAGSLSSSAAASSGSSDSSSGAVTSGGAAPAPAPSELSEAELDAMAAAMMAGENPFTAAAPPAGAGGGAAAAAAAAARARAAPRPGGGGSSGAGGMPKWFGMR